MTGDMCENQMRIKIKRLQAEVNGHRQRADFLVELIRKHCPKALTHVPTRATTIFPRKRGGRLQRVRE